MGGKRPRSVQTSIERPEHGDFITLSWAQSVTDNVTQEAVGVGMGVGNTFAPSPPKEALNDLLQRAHNTMEDNDALPAAGVFEVEGANVSDDNAFPEMGFDQQNALCTTTIDAFDGKKLGVTRKEIGPGGEAYSTVMGPTYVKIEFQDEASLDYPYVIPVPGKKDYVRAAPYGNARLLWHGEIDPSVFTEDCNSVIQNGYINIGDDCWWQFFKLEQPLQVCGYAQAFIVDHCGRQIGTCKIRRTVWLSDTNCHSHPLPAGTVVLCFWFTWLNKWVAIDWQEHCPDFEEFTPEETSLVKTAVPVRFEYSVTADPCDPNGAIIDAGFNDVGGGGAVGSNANTRGGGETIATDAPQSATRDVLYPQGSDANNGGGGANGEWGGDNDSCSFYLVYNESRYYKDDCGLFCLYDTEEKRIPVTFPSFASYIPVFCTVNEIQGGDDSDSSSSSSDISDSGSDSCACVSGRYIHIVYPEVQINCGKICFTGNTIEAPGCDISLTQDEPITQYSYLFEYIENYEPCETESDSGICAGCSTLVITPRNRNVKIACDEWCISDWIEEDPIKIPVVACEGGDFTYIDNITFFPSEECGCIEYVITYAPVSLHCGAICPDSLVQSDPIKICMNGETTELEVITGVKGSIDIEGNSKTVLQDVSLDLSGLSLTGGTPQSVVANADFYPSKLNLTDKTNQEVVKAVTYTKPSLNINNVSIPTISGATLDTSKLTLTGTAASVLTGVQITDLEAALQFGNAVNAITGVTLNPENLTVTIPLNQYTGGVVSGTIRVSIPIKKKEVVTSVSVSGCEINGTTEDVWVLNPSTEPQGETGNLDIDISVSNLSVNLNQTTQTTASGTISVKQGYSALSTTSAYVQQPSGVNIQGNLHTDEITIPLVTGITAQTGAIALTAGNPITAIGSATLNQGDISTTKETIQTPTKVSADANDPAFIKTTANITVPNTINGQSSINKSTTTVTDAGSATYTAKLAKKTLNFNHGVLCDIDESQSSDSSNS